ncbi:hypothetical protein [Spirosoma sp.]|nr:hypothetical protein [Spirosoma sp.]MCX6217689.1 hypothetical protein [Spirosoma sp.]
MKRLPITREQGTDFAIGFLCLGLTGFILAYLTTCYVWPYLIALFS